MFSAIVPKHKLHLVRNGVAVESYTNIKKQINPGLLVGIGRVAQNKGIDRLIHAVAELRKLVPTSNSSGPDPTKKAASESSKIWLIKRESAIP